MLLHPFMGVGARNCMTCCHLGPNLHVRPCWQPKLLGECLRVFENDGSERSSPRLWLLVGRTADCVLAAIIAVRDFVAA